MQKAKVAIIVGSLRKDSLNRKLATAMTRLAPDNLEFFFVEIGDLPLYDPDLEQETPASWARFRNDIRAADALLFVTPEYNRSVPASIKNAIDVGSRPMSDSVWRGKPGAVVSGSMGAMGGFGANHHLRQALVFLNVPTMAQPEAYVGGLGSLFDEHGALVKDDTEEFLGNFMSAFARWIGNNRAK